MKTAIRIMAAGLAASLALVSCAKQEAMDNGSTSPAGGARTIAVSFANASVKSALGEDGLTPKFVATDVIKVSNGSATEDCTVEIDGSGNASITTELTGALTMVYPAAAWSDTEPHFKVSTEQNGTFASANICKATIMEGATDATFEQQTAVFCITPGAGASTKYVELITAGAEIANSVPAGSEYDTMHKIHVASASAAPVYVSILVPEGLKIRDLSFADGSNMKTLKDDTDAIAVNSLYTVDNANWNRPYAEIGGLKWATMNLGATTVTGTTSYGDLFSWGDVAPKSNYDISYYISPAKDIASDIAPDSGYDAANVNWGGAWRMPTGGSAGEFAALKAATYWKWGDGGYYVYTPNPATDAGKINSNGTGTYSKSNALLFFPAAGFSNGASRFSAGTFGDYWSSAWGSSSGAYYLYFGGSNVGPEGLTSRSYGFSVRPVSD